MRRSNAAPSDAARRAGSVAVVGATALALLTTIAARAPVDGLDRRFSVWADARGAGHRHVIQLVTDLGSWPVVLPLAVSLCLALQLGRRVALGASVPVLAAALTGEEVLQRLLKEAVDRARPTLEPAAATLGPAFPSGHSATAAAFYGAAALLLGRGRAPRTRIALLAAAVALGLVVAATRLLLAVHWLTDVAGGLALGWSWVALCVLSAHLWEARRAG